jgi:SAM-dependent methyltransferase
MADRPQLPVNAATRAALDEHDAGAISAEVALMRLLLAGVPAEELPRLLADRPGLMAVAARHGAGLARLEAVARAGAVHGAGIGLDATRAMFDRLVAISPEASVAAYSLGDPATLQRATVELVEWLRAEALLAGRPRVLDLGCGIGRVAAAIAPEAEAVLGLDISAGMIAAARARHAAIGNLRFAICGGGDLAGVADAAFDLVLAVDVFPYAVQAGLAEGLLAEAARVTRPGGTVVILNWSYDDTAAPAAHGLRPRCAAMRPFRLWDATVHRLARG